MSELRDRHKLTRFIPDPQIKLNQFVIIEEPHLPRSRWKTGQIEEFVISQDGFNNGCKLHVIGKRGHYFIKRPVKKLYPLEIRNSDNSVAKIVVKMMAP